MYFKIIFSKKTPFRLFDCLHASNQFNSYCMELIILSIKYSMTQFLLIK